MTPKRILWIALALVAGVIVLIFVSLSLTPESSPAFDAAVRFIEAAGKGDDSVAFALLAPQMKDYVHANCPNGSVSACVRSYTPPEWGDFQNGVFRRAAPDGQNWNVQIIADY